MYVIVPFGVLTPLGKPVELTSQCLILNLVLAMDGQRIAIPGPEFVIVLCLQVGIPLFPVSPLCVCLASIDQFGDHGLLECSHGPMRICCHDALVDIVCDALSHSHPENKFSLVKSILAPVVYTTLHGHPAHFDVPLPTVPRPIARKFKRAVL